MAAVRPLIGVIGDLDLTNPTHRFTNDALAHAGAEVAWIPTASISPDPDAAMRRCRGLLIAPGSPYRDMEGAIAAIRHARECGVPLVGT
jgi:CTP synthase (UTP-ammonia lyase)